MFESNEFGKAARWELEWNNDADKNKRRRRRGGGQEGFERKTQMSVWRGEL